MLTRITDFSDSLDLFDQLRRQMDAVWDDWGAPRGPARSLSPSAVRLNLYDTGAELVLQADVPGVTDKDLEISLYEGVLTIAGERKLAKPEGYTARGQERASYRFSRSIALPAKVDAEKTSAAVKDGVLTVTLTKAPEARPRQIAVKTQS